MTEPSDSSSSFFSYHSLYQYSPMRTWSSPSQSASSSKVTSSRLTGSAFGQCASNEVLLILSVYHQSSASRLSRSLADGSQYRQNGFSSGSMSMTCAHESSAYLSVTRQAPIPAPT